MHFDFYHNSVFKSFTVKVFCNLLITHLIHALYGSAEQIKLLLDQQESLYARQSELKTLLEECEASGSHHADVSSTAPENWSGSFKWDSQADDLRLNIFGISSYRACQREVRTLFTCLNSTEKQSNLLLTMEFYVKKYGEEYMAHKLNGGTIILLCFEFLKYLGCVNDIIWKWNRSKQAPAHSSTPNNVVALQDVVVATVAGAATGAVVVVTGVVVEAGAEVVGLLACAWSDSSIQFYQIVNAVMSGRDVLVIMAAGGGKSLCYQLPAVLRDGICLVVSPLLSLIQDQVMGLAALGIPAYMLTSTTVKEDEKFIYKALEKNEGVLKILYVTPEKISKSKRFMSKLEKCHHAGRLSLIAIDEAHCCSQWGHDFRPDYKNLGILKTQFSTVPVIALTATATKKVQLDLMEMLRIQKCVKFVSSVNRPNLFYMVSKHTSVAFLIGLNTT
ncbi:Mediator of RNA polymerase II transcription subunit 34 [Bienertia sinuspersici]